MAISAIYLCQNQGGAVTGASVPSPNLGEGREGPQKFGAIVQTTFYVEGTFGGASFQIQASPDSPSTADSSSSWFNVGTALTTAGLSTVSISASKFRAVTTGGTGSSLTCRMM